MKAVKLILLIGLTAMVVWNCSNSTSSDPANGQFVTGSHAEGTTIPVQADSLTGVAKQIPGFGGLFINDSDKLSIYLTNPDEQKATAKEVLSNSEFIQKMLSQMRARGPKYRSVSVSNMKVLKGQYTLAKLRKWKKEISGKVLTMDGVYTSGVDQSRNRVLVGVKNKTVSANVNKKLTELDIPEEAVLMHQMTPPEYPIDY